MSLLQPTAAVPGSFEKILVLKQRARWMLSLFHPDDAPLPDSHGFSAQVSPNGSAFPEMLLKLSGVMEQLSARPSPPARVRTDEEKARAEQPIFRLEEARRKRALRAARQIGRQLATDPKTVIPRETIQAATFVWKLELVKRKERFWDPNSILAQGFYVQARTRSEARAEAKKVLGLKGKVRLIRGIKITRVDAATLEGSNGVGEMAG